MKKEKFGDQAKSCAVVRITGQLVRMISVFAMTTLTVLGHVKNTTKMIRTAWTAGTQIGGKQ